MTINELSADKNQFLTQMTGGGNLPIPEIKQENLLSFQPSLNQIHEMLSNELESRPKSSDKPSQFHQLASQTFNLAN